MDDGDTNSTGAAVSLQKERISTFACACVHAIRDIFPVETAASVQLVSPSSTLAWVTYSGRQRSMTPFYLSVFTHFCCESLCWILKISCFAPIAEK